MQAFCPVCANMLLLKHMEKPVSEDGNSNVMYACSFCTYKFAVERKLSTPLYLVRKQVEDVMGGESEWKGVPTTEVTCEKCGHGQAYFKEVQIRSADEPATLFFRCCKCGDIRREG